MKKLQRSKSGVLPQALKKDSRMTTLQVQACQGVRGGQKGKKAGGTVSDPNYTEQTK